MSELLDTTRTITYWPAVGEISALYAEWNAALATGDPHQVADRYTPDAVLLPTLSNDVRTDRAGIVDYFARFQRDRPLGVVLKSYVRVLRSTEAIDSGICRFTLKRGGGTVHIDARYTFVYEKIDGKWMIVTHHSSELPEAS